MMSKYILTGHNLRVQVGKDKTILDIPEFYLEAGETLALIGPNGAGKSTLIQVLALLKMCSTGYLEFKGKLVTRRDLLALRRQMAVVFQEPLLLDTTVYENVAIGLKIRGVEKGSIRAKVEEWLERFGIRELAQRSSRYLSGGEAQRVSLARAFVLEPKVLFLDEPFSSLDTPTRATLMEELEALLRSTGISTVFVTHNYPEVEALAQRVLVIQDGKLINQGTPKEVFSGSNSRWFSLNLA
jgi:tungstate transport system ATP-binding protein